MLVSKFKTHSLLSEIATQDNSRVMQGFTYHFRSCGTEYRIDKCSIKLMKVLVAVLCRR